MAQPPNQKRFLAEDFPKEQRDGLRPLIEGINQYFTEVTFGLSGQLSVKDNLLAEYRDLDVTMPAVGSPFPISFRCKFASRAMEVIVAQVQEVVANPAPLTAPVWADWDWTNGLVQIRNVTGLAASRRYKIRLRINYG